jgi:multicomponent Na+:H+ antiporter subunit C
MEYFSNILSNYPYIFALLMIMTGFYVLIIEKNLIKKVIGVNLIQGGIIIFYVIIGKIKDGVPPVANVDGITEVYSNPTPHVLMLTAIVVGVATTSLACALIFIIYKKYGTINETELLKINEAENQN